MKRRKFITSAFGSACIINAPKLPTWIYETKQQQWLENFLTKLNAKKNNRYLSLDKDLQETYQNTFKNWLKNGYKPLNANFYIFEGKNLALFPVILDVASTGTLDISTLCFAKTTAGIWQPLTHFTGFHLEAFQLLTQDLEEKLDSRQLADALLPVFSVTPKNSSNGYLSISGEISMKILTDVSSSKISIAVKVDTKEIWTKNYLSKNFQSNTFLAFSI